MTRILWETGNKGILSNNKKLATLLPVITWKMENITNKLYDLFKEVSRKNIKSSPVLFLLPIIKWEKYQWKKNCSVYSLQRKFIQNIGRCPDLLSLKKKERQPKKHGSQI